MISTPADVVECTLHPLRLYPVDAAILFSDILVVAEALGVEVTMPGGVGIQVPNPLRGPEEVGERIVGVEAVTPEFVEEKLGFVTEAIGLILAKMEEEGFSVPLIGFSGAPFTLLYYMIGGSSRKNTEVGKVWLRDHPVESRHLLDVLTKLIIEYMASQVEVGAYLLPLFETVGMMLDKEEFEEFTMPCFEEITRELKGRYPNVLLMIFYSGAWQVFECVCSWCFSCLLC